jgi:hypothetical protein
MSEPFVKCPFCAGHELVTPEAADAIAELIGEPRDHCALTPTGVELQNIRNAILNTREREDNDLLA